MGKLCQQQMLLVPCTTRPANQGCRARTMSATKGNGGDAKPDWAATAEKWAPAGFALLGAVCMAGGERACGGADPLG